MLQLAVPGDFEAVNEMARQVHSLHCQWRPDIYEMVPQLFSKERFEAAIRDRQLYVAKLGGVPVGYTALKMRSYDWAGVVSRKVMVVDEFCVLESCRNQGIGTAMMEDIHALARAFGCTDLQLGVYPQNEAAVAFYQKCGFQIRSLDMQKKV